MENQEMVMEKSEGTLPSLDPIPLDLMIKDNKSPRACCKLSIITNHHHDDMRCCVFQVT